MLVCAVTLARLIAVLVLLPVPLAVPTKLTATPLTVLAPALALLVTAKVLALPVELA